MRRSAFPRQRSHSINWLFGVVQGRCAALNHPEQRLECRAACATLAHIQHHKVKSTDCKIRDDSRQDSTKGYTLPT